MNHAQLRNRQLDPSALYEEVIYKRSLIGLGKTPANWAYAAFYEQAQKDIVRVTFDDTQVAPSTISDNVFRHIGVQYGTENIRIRPFIVELPQSSFAQQNDTEVIPQVITELNRRLDEITFSQLDRIATVGQAISYNTPDEFIKWAVRATSNPEISDLRKHLVIPESVRASFLGHATFPDSSSWFVTLTRRMAENNCDIIISKVGEKAFVIVEPFLAEYTGMEPHVFAQGSDERKHEEWIQFAFSNSDYKLRNPLGLQSFAVEYTGEDAIATTRVTTTGKERKTSTGHARAISGEKA